MFNNPLPLLAIALTILILGAAFTLLRARLFVQNMRTMHVLDVSDLNIPPPPVLQIIINALLDLGFRRLGEAGLPDVPGGTSSTAQVWYFIDRDATACAGVFTARYAPADVVIFSWFGDKAVIVTGYPYGEFIEEPNYRFHTITSGVADAYQHHLEQIADFAMRYGEPRRLDTMDEVLRLDRLYNQKFAARRQRPVVQRELITFIFQLYLMVVVLGIYAGLELLDLPPLIVLAGGALLVLPALIVYLRSRRRRG